VAYRVEEADSQEGGAFDFSGWRSLRSVSVAPGAIGLGHIQLVPVFSPKTVTPVTASLGITVDVTIRQTYIQAQGVV